MSPLCVVQGHDDWIFSAEFVSEDVVISGGRDCLVKWWKIVTSDESTKYHCLAAKKEHDRKVRDLKYDKNKLLFTLSADNYLKCWDIETCTVSSSVYLSPVTELIALAVSKQFDLVGIGSQHASILVDSRTKTIVTTIPSQDADWGTRSINFANNIMSIGGGMGHLSFYDLRANKFLELESGATYLTSGEGWLDKNETYYNQFYGMRIPNAIYTHSYSPSGTKVFIGGGPLMLQLNGSYASIWS